jgi:hypothetical protein
MTMLCLETRRACLQALTAHELHNVGGDRFELLGARVLEARPARGLSACSRRDSRLDCRVHVYAAGTIGSRGSP